MRHIIFLLFVALVFSLTGLATAADSAKPNIIFILADDWGYGDVKCFGGDLCKIDTPSMDKLAKEGRMFTDAHSSSSVCTPTRYSVLTGRYNWRSRIKKGVLNGYGERLIEQDRATVASFLRDQGYTTACVGKWHLGMHLPRPENAEAIKKSGKKSRKKDDEKKESKEELAAKFSKMFDWDGKITDGPTAVGFDYFYGITASLDMPPYVWIENDRFTEPGTRPNQMCRSGPQGATFEFDQVLPTIAKKSVAWIEEQAKGKKPFFLYMPLNSPHTPIVPSKAFLGKSKVGKYGDFVMETDWAIGQVVDTIDKLGLKENTLIMVTADNGCSPAASRGAGKNQGTVNVKIAFRMGETNAKDDPASHYACGVFRGHKADIYDGGHRVPYIARWTGKIPADTKCDALICHVDLFATCAAVLGKKLPSDAGEDSFNILDNLLGKSCKSPHEAVVHHSINGSFSIRQGKWKLIFTPSSGGWSKGPKLGEDATPLEKVAQLYNLDTDIAETGNLIDKEPEVVKELTKLMVKYIEEGRSTPGPKSANTDGDPALMKESGLELLLGK